MSSGTGGFYSCVHPPTLTGCTPDGITPPEGPYDTSSCSVEGARCDGTFCYDMHGGGPWVETCCGGRWWPGFSGTCPGVLQPGDPVACGPDLTCSAYRSYCLEANADRTTARNSCETLCAAGDCTCFCDDPDACEFQAPGSDCPADRCTCSKIAAPPGIRQTGAIQVQCRYVVHDSRSCPRNKSLDGQCGAGLKAYVCEGPANTGGPCALLPDLATNASCGTEVHEYCCAN